MKISDSVDIMMAGCQAKDDELWKTLIFENAARFGRTKHMPYQKKYGAKYEFRAVSFSLFFGRYLGRR